MSESHALDRRAGVGLESVSAILGVLLGLGLLVGGALGVLAQENLVQNPDFEAGTYKFENLWDGVDGQGRLKLLEGASPVVTDLNGDGKKDLIAGEGRGLIFYYLNNGTNQEPKFSSGIYVRARFDDQVRLSAADWNADGRVDFLIGGRNGWVYELKNRGNKTEFSFVTREPKGGRKAWDDYMKSEQVGTPDTPRSVSIPQRVVGEYIKVGPKMLDIGQYSAPAAADWDGDGRVDLLLGEGTYGADSIYLFLNSGSNTSPQFATGSQRYIAYGEGRIMLCPAAADWDGDGLVDLLVGEESGKINVFSRDPGKKAEAAAFRGTLSASGGEIKIPGARPAVADWDEDGDLDVICGGSDGLIYLIKNGGSAGKPSLGQPVPLTGEDVKKDTDMPNAWSCEPWGRERAGAYQPSIGSEDPKSGKYFLMMQCLDKYPGTTYVTVGLTKPTGKDADYILTFYVKGQGAGDCDWNLIYGVKGISPEGKRYANASSQGGQFAAGGAWKRVMERVHMPKDYDERGAPTLLFRTYGDGTLCLDNVSFAAK